MLPTPADPEGVHLAQLFDPTQFLTPEARRAEAHQRITAETSIKDLVDPEWITRSAAEGLIARALFGWTLADEEFDGERLLEMIGKHAEILSSVRYRRSGKTEILARFDGTLVEVVWSPPKRAWVAVAAKTDADANAIIERLLKLLPEEQKNLDGPPSVALTVWTSTNPEGNRRITEVAGWEDIAGNYAAATRDALSALMEPDFEAGRGGRLILLHGAPGTGKSTALSTLAWQWRAWAELHYVADPATFLTDPDYLLHVSLGRLPDEDWRAVLLEDAGGLFAPDAKSNIGEDRLGRLLNATDGMLGNASKALYLITTNEPLSSFHEAVSRPGRCAAAIEFLPLSQEEAQAWLESHERPDLAADVTGERTLAELFGLLEGNRVESAPKHHVGFRAVG